MTSTMLSGEEFDQDPERAKTLTAQGPVYVTEALSMPGLSDIDLDRDLPRFNERARRAELD